MIYYSLIFFIIKKKLMKKGVTIIFSMLMCLTAFSQNIIEPCKYGQPLINAIQTSYSPTQTMGYGPGRDTLYASIDSDNNDLYCVYTNFKVTLNPSDDPSQSAFQDGNGINAEHVYPQSKGASNEPMKSDLHNIFPSKVNVNSARGSCPFDDIDDNNTDVWYFESSSSSSIPTSNIDAYSEKDNNSCEFEPREGMKGNIARAVFYFYATYQNIANSADANFFPLQKQKLLEWHYADPADSIERRRSYLIGWRQGNQNPFVLDSTLARRAFFMADASYPAGDPNCYDQLSSTHQPQNADWVNLRSTFIENDIIIDSKINNGQVHLFNLMGQNVASQSLNNQTIINTSHLRQGIYLVKIRAKSGEQVTFKVWVNSSN